MASRPGLEIRAAAAADAEGLSDLLAEIGHAVAADRLAERIEALRRGSGAVLVAMEWGPPSGVASVSWRSELLAERPVAVIDTLVVAPDARRRGLGRLLLKAASQAARSAGCAELELRAALGDASMPGFCEATGFRLVGAVYERPLRKAAKVVRLSA